AAFKLQKLGRIDVVVDREGIAAAGDVLESETEREIVAGEAETPLQKEVQGEVVGKAARIRGSHKLLLQIHDVEGQACVPVGRESNLPPSCERKRQISP